MDDFEAYVVARGDALHRTAYLLTRDHALAEDLVQTALAEAWGSWRRIEGDPDPYVRRVLVNTFASWWRRRWNGERATMELPEQPHTGGDVDTHLDLAVAVAQLPRRQRAVIVLRFFDDLTEVQTAEAMGTTVGTVKSQTARALAALRVDPGLSPVPPTVDEPVTTVHHQPGSTR